MTQTGGPELDEILDAVTAGSRVLVGIAMRSLARSGADLTLSQCRALVTLTKHGPMSLVGLAEALAVNPSTATRMCDRLVAKELLSRERVAGGVSLRPTPVGLKVVDAVTRVRRDELRRVVARLSKDDQRELIRCMDAFRTAAGELGGGGWGFAWGE